MMINEHPSNDDEKFRAQPYGCFNLDAKINVCIRGSMSEDETEEDTWLLGTATGGVYELVRLPSYIY